MSETSGVPKVSVVLTCYNMGRFLDEAVDSVFAQTLQDFEIVIVDDGSTDPETVRLLTGYRRPKTRVIHIENRGLPGARNAGIRQSEGPYVCALDADDRLEKTYFEKAVAVLDADPSIAFVSHWLKTFGEEEYEWKPKRADFPALLDRNTINGAALVRREALTAVGLFDESMRFGCEDWDLWISMVEQGFRGVILPEVLFFYRRRGDSMSRVMMADGETHVGLYRYLIEKHRSSFDAHLVELLLRREVDNATALRESHDLELDCEIVLRPEIERLRDQLRTSKHKLERLRMQKEVESYAANAAGLQREIESYRAGTEALQREVESYRAGTEALQREVESYRTNTAGLQRELEGYRESAAGLAREIRALRSSLSWRITRPLRAVYSFLFGRG